MENKHRQIYVCQIVLLRYVYLHVRLEMGSLLCDLKVGFLEWHHLWNSRNTVLRIVVVLNITSMHREENRWIARSYALHAYTHMQIHTHAHTYSCLLAWHNIFFKIWCIVALHYSVSFCSTTKWISYMYTYIPNTFDLPPKPSSRPSRSLQSTELSSLRCTAASH